MRQLKEIASYVSDKIDVKKMVIADYISTDNMLPEKGGIVACTTMPKANRVTQYETGDVLVSNIRPYFKKIWFADRMGGCSNDVIVFRVIDEIQTYPKYLFYLLSQNYFFDYMMSGSNGTKMPRGNKNLIPEFSFNYVEIEKQKRIVGILSTYDILIENNQTQIKLIEEAAMRLYKEWFVNLRFPGHETAKIVDGVPEGWTRAKTKDFMKFKYGKALKTDNRKTGQYPVYGSSGVIGYHNDFIVEGPAIIVGRKGNVGSVYLSFSDAYPIDTVYYIESDISILFSYFNLMIRTFNNNDSAVPGLNRDYAESMEMICPNIDLLNEFNNKASVLLELQNNLRCQINLLKQARDKLLPKLMSGEVEV